MTAASFLAAPPTLAAAGTWATAGARCMERCSAEAPVGTHVLAPFACLLHSFC